MPGDKSGCTLNHNRDAGHYHLNKSDKVERAHEEGVEQEKKGGKPEMDGGEGCEEMEEIQIVSAYDPS